MAQKIILAVAKPSRKITQYFLIPLIIVSLIAASRGYFQPIVQFLNSEDLTFHIGNISFSVYSIIKVIFAVIILIWVANFVSAFGENKIKSSKIRASNKQIVIKVFNIFVYIIAFLIGLDAVGIKLTALTVFSGAIGIGIGFGLQKVAANFVSGLILLFEKSMKIGDLIELNDGTSGFVKRMTSRYTLIEAHDGKEMIIPNEDFITSRVVNLTYSNNKSRGEILVGVSYKSDIKKAKQLILEAALEHENVSKDKLPTVFLRQFSDSSVNFTLFFWVDDVLNGKFGVQDEIMFSIWDKFKANNIELPYPQRDIYIYNKK